MRSTTFVRFFYALAIFFSITHANWFEDNVFLRPSYGRHIPKRQINPAGSPLPATTTVPSGTGPIAPAEVTTSASSSAPKPSPTTQAPPDTSTTEPKTTTSATENPPQTKSSNPTSTQKTSSPTSTQQSEISSTNGRSSAATTTARPSSTISQSVELITSVVTVSGSVVTTVSSSTTEVPVSQPTGVQPSPDPGASSSGMSTKTRNTIIGVVVGVGGTALLAGLSIVAWRIWGRKKDADEDHGLMDFRTGSPGKEKALGAGNVRSANPFQSTLENYHNPTRVNASSNF
ncbi:hypothetical protein K3495_g9159 [Podosphaera aphanis]|nr:hypothetical protein K3495_g9159 [Podosphaera aphanis]